MKFGTCFALLALFLGSIGQVTAQQEETVVSLDLDGLTLPMALEQIAARTGALFVVEPSLRAREGAKVSINNVPLSRAISIIAATYEVCAHDTGRIVKIRACGS